jgi:hypothetical protein
MIKLRGDFVITKIEPKGKVLKTKSVSIEQYLCDALASTESNKVAKHTGYNALCKVIRKNSKRKKGQVKIMAEVKDGQEVELVNDSFEELTIPERIFFILYNSVNYYDEEFGGKTYLNDALCWLIAFAKRDDNVKEYGRFVVPDSEGYEPQAIYGMSKFRFHSAEAFMKVRSKARNVLKNHRVVESTKELVNQLLKDPEEARTKYILAVDNLAKTTDSDKVKLECYRVLGNWLGIDRPIAVVNNNLIFKGIESALASEDFGNLLEDSE